MHLMVLGASRPRKREVATIVSVGLNAPDGAGCFPTPYTGKRLRTITIVSMHLMLLGASRLSETKARSLKLIGLNAPDGAGCFPTERSGDRRAGAQASQCA